MNDDQKLDKLLRIARSIPASDKVPFAFERRIMAQLRKPAPTDPLEVWGRIFWRVAAAGLGVALLVAVWSMAAPRSSNRTQDLANDLDQTILAPFGSLAKPW